jgi:hypothetical protein
VVENSEHERDSGNREKKPHRHHQHDQPARLPDLEDQLVFQVASEDHQTRRHRERQRRQKDERYGDPLLFPERPASR